MSPSSSSFTFYLFLSNEMDTEQLTPSTLTICKAPNSNRIYHVMHQLPYLRAWACVRYAFALSNSIDQFPKFIHFGNLNFCSRNEHNVFIEVRSVGWQRVSICVWDRQPHNISIGEIGNSQFIHSLGHFQFYHFGFALWSSVITNFILSLNKQTQTYTHTQTQKFFFECSLIFEEILQVVRLVSLMNTLLMPCHFWSFRWQLLPQYFNVRCSCLDMLHWTNEWIDAN